jgi:hypothetical protein
MRRGNFRKAAGLLGLRSNQKLPKKLSRKLGIRTVKQLTKKRRKEYLLHKRKADYSAIARNASDAWLEFHFGWSPLVKDIYDISHAAADVLYRVKPPMYRISGYGEKDIVFRKTQDPPYSVYHTFSTSGKVFVAITGHYRVGNESDFDSNTLGLANPASAFYEAVPFSFVLDWVWPLGKWIEGWTSLSGLQFVSGSYATVMHWDAVISLSFEKQYSYYTKKRDASGSTKYRSFTRDVKEPPRAPTLPPVKLGEMLDAWKITTSLALMKSSLVYR